MKRLTALLIIWALLTSSVPVFAKSNDVKVKIAPFYTEIQSMSVDNRYVEFPLITYKDITYFPMTFSLCRSLGLVSGFDSEKGLFITREEVGFYEETPNYFGGDAINYYDTSYAASIPTYPIYLNGIYIDNTKEEYPLLNFRGITYFPMTWCFAYEELNFDVEWSEKDYSFRLRNDGKSSAPYAYGTEGNVVKLQKQVSGYTESINENGDTRYTLSLQYYANYDFDTSDQKIYRRQDTQQSINYGLPSRNDILTYEKADVTLKDKCVYMDDTLLINLENEEILNAPYAKEYSLGDSSLIMLTIQTSNAPAPYTTYKEYFLRKDATGIKNLEWDEKNNLACIYPDGKGGFYVATNGYRPAYSSRWCNSFSDIYYYNPETSEFVSLSQKYSDIFNAMDAIGMTDGKLYLRGMWYSGDKARYHDRGMHLFAAVNSGYYALDLETGELTKLYPYICGETFIGPDKNLYCISNASRIPRIVNLNTGVVIPVE